MNGVLNSSWIWSLIIAVTNMNGSSKHVVPETIHIETTTIGGLPKKENRLIDGAFLM